MGGLSVLLGYRSVQTTERYHAPWDRQRRDRLTRVVRVAQRLDPDLAEISHVPHPPAHGREPRRKSALVPRKTGRTGPARIPG